MACSLLRATAYLPGHKCCLSRFSGTLRPRLHRESNRYQYLALTPLHWFWFSQSTRNRRVLSYNVNGILLHKAEILQQVRNATKSLPVFYPGCMLTYHKLFVSSRLHSCITRRTSLNVMRDRLFWNVLWFPKKCNWIQYVVCPKWYVLPGNIATSRLIDQSRQAWKKNSILLLRDWSTTFGKRGKNLHRYFIVYRYEVLHACTAKRNISSSKY